MTINDFDDIRPYNEEEVPAAMQRIASSDAFPILSSFIYPGEPIEQVRQRVGNYTSVREFQLQTMCDINRRVVDTSITQLSFTGLEQLSPSGAYLYVSNHRDIMLDSSLLQYIFVNNGFDTTEITFGANLMMNQLIIDIGKCNKMFRVERPGGSIKEFYKGSRHLSDYIRFVITQKHHSVWIAQRNGRTKDGRDLTDKGIIKMFAMSEPDDKIAALEQLHIVPMSISYEWEPCDVLKTLEIYESQFTRYTKKPGEDLNSILTGVLQQKGRGHIELCEPVTAQELSALAPLTNSDYHKQVAAIIDRRIISAYRLYPNNFVAYDLHHGTTRFADRYTAKQKNAFVRRMKQLESYDTCDVEQLIDIFLGIYANPVATKLAIADTKNSTQETQ